MIARVWRGWTLARDADAYAAYVEASGMQASRDTAGSLGTMVLHRLDGDRAAFVTITYWESLAAIAAFAGPVRERAVFFPDDDRFLVECELTVHHYDVASHVLPQEV